MIFYNLLFKLSYSTVICVWHSQIYQKKVGLNQGHCLWISGVFLSELQKFQCMSALQLYINVFVINSCVTKFYFKEIKAVLTSSSVLRNDCDKLDSGRSVVNKVHSSCSRASFFSWCWILILIKPLFMNSPTQYGAVPFQFWPSQDKDLAPLSWYPSLQENLATAPLWLRSTLPLLGGDSL